MVSRRLFWDTKNLKFLFLVSPRSWKFNFSFSPSYLRTNLIGDGRSKESSRSKNHCEEFQTGFKFYNYLNYNPHSQWRNHFHQKQLKVVKGSLGGKYSTSVRSLEICQRHWNLNKITTKLWSVWHCSQLGNYHYLSLYVISKTSWSTWTYFWYHRLNNKLNRWLLFSDHILGEGVGLFLSDLVICHSRRSAKVLF